MAENILFRYYISIFHCETLSKDNLISVSEKLAQCKDFGILLALKVRRIIEDKFSWRYDSRGVDRIEDVDQPSTLLSCCLK